MTGSGSRAGPDPRPCPLREAQFPPRPRLSICPLLDSMSPLSPLGHWEGVSDPSSHLLKLLEWSVTWKLVALAETCKGRGTGRCCGF